MKVKYLTKENSKIGKYLRFLWGQMDEKLLSRR